MRTQIQIKDAVFALRVKNRVGTAAALNGDVAFDIKIAFANIHQVAVRAANLNFINAYGYDNVISDAAAARRATAERFIFIRGGDGFAQRTPRAGSIHIPLVRRRRHINIVDLRRRVRGDGER